MYEHVSKNRAFFVFFLICTIFGTFFVIAMIIGWFQSSFVEYVALRARALRTILARAAQRAQRTLPRLRAQLHASAHGRPAAGAPLGRRGGLCPA